MEIVLFYDRIFGEQYTYISSPPTSVGLLTNLDYVLLFELED